MHRSECRDLYGRGIFNYSGVQINIPEGGGGGESGTRILKPRKINETRQKLVVPIVSFERLTLSACVA